MILATQIGMKQMVDGIDRKAFEAEMRKLSPLERKTRTRQVTGWLRAAARSKKARRATNLAAVCGLLSALLGGGGYIVDSRILLANATAMLAPTLLLCLESNRRAREWRRAYPFNSWSAH